MNDERRSGEILVVEDDHVALKNLRRILERAGHAVQAVAGGDKACVLLETQPFDLVLTDLIMEPIDGLELLSRVRAMQVTPPVQVIILTAYASIPTAIRAMKKGAFHYLQKPYKTEEVLHLVDLALEKRWLMSQVDLLEQRADADLAAPLGISPDIRGVRHKIRQLGETDVNVMITGASGTGKELVARAIHKASSRRAACFMAINCASFTDELLANELFGHERDAFTGATSRKVGLLEAANGGTVFFDEVGDMPLHMQAKLMRVIQEREVIRVGGSKPVAIDVRIISATNKDLKRAVQHGSFRADLYYRLTVVPIHISPLSKRREDIPLLARHFLERFNQRSGKEILGFSREVMDLLLHYEFPGNVRELENMVEGGAAMCRSEVIEVDNLPMDIKELQVMAARANPAHIKTLEEVEREYVESVLTLTGHNKSKTARLLGIDRTSLYRKLKRRQLID